MLLVRCDRSVPGPVEEALRAPLDHLDPEQVETVLKGTLERGDL